MDRTLRIVVIVTLAGLVLALHLGIPCLLLPLVIPFALWHNKTGGNGGNGNTP